MKPVIGGSITPIGGIPEGAFSNLSRKGGPPPLLCNDYTHMYIHF